MLLCSIRSLQTYTGDVLVSNIHMASKLKAHLHKGEVFGGTRKSASSEDEEVPSVFQSLVIPEPVFFCTVEPSSAAHQKGTVYAHTYTQGRTSQFDFITTECTQ